MTPARRSAPRRAPRRIRVGVAVSTPDAADLADPTTFAAFDGARRCADEAMEALREAGHDPFLVEVRRAVAPAVAALRAGGAQVVVNLVEEVAGEAEGEIRFARALEAARLQFTGSRAPALRLALDKAASKRALAKRGVPVPEWAVFERGDDAEWHGGRWPAIVKPLREDGSLGIDRGSVCADAPSLRRRVDKVAAAFRQPAIVERYVDGRELNVSILEGARLPVSEIEFRGAASRPRIVTFRSKWAPGSADDRATRPRCPAAIDAGTERRARSAAARAVRALGIRDYARVDLRVDAGGAVFVLEANPNPDLASDAGFSRAARAAGLSAPRLYSRLVARALARGRAPR